MSTAYDDIIDLPHHVSPTRRRMSSAERAAQFAPFAALTGYDDAIAETARLTQDALASDEEHIRALNETLLLLQKHLAEKPEITVTYFVPDGRKAGGAFETRTARLHAIRTDDQSIVLSDGTQLAMERIAALESDCLSAPQQEA